MTHVRTSTVCIRKTLYVTATRISKKVQKLLRRKSPFSCQLILRSISPAPLQFCNFLKSERRFDFGTPKMMGKEIRFQPTFRRIMPPLSNLSYCISHGRLGKNFLNRFVRPYSFFVRWFNFWQGVSDAPSFI